VTALHEQQRRLFPSELRPTALLKCSSTCEVPPQTGFTTLSALTNLTALRDEHSIVPRRAFRSNPNRLFGSINRVGVGGPIRIAGKLGMRKSGNVLVLINAARTCSSRPRFVLPTTAQKVAGNMRPGGTPSPLSRCRLRGIRSQSADVEVELDTGSRHPRLSLQHCGTASQDGRHRVSCFLLVSSKKQLLVMSALSTSFAASDSEPSYAMGVRTWWPVARA